MIKEALSMTDLKVLQLLEFIHQKISRLEETMNRQEENLKASLVLLRHQIVHVKNGIPDQDETILYSLPYNDLSPQKAFHFITQGHIDFILLNVGRETIDHKKFPTLNENLHIPLEQLKSRFHEIPKKLMPLILISEDGLDSIKACEWLASKGFYHLNNISGGLLFWPDKKNNPFFNPLSKVS
jgi:rhodanese-related sulfurtransferase